jgi:hypothetical protein
MRKFTVAAAIAVLAASLASFVALPRSPASLAPLGAISPYELTIASPALTTGAAADAF